MRVMRPLRRLAAMRRASVAVILGLLLTVAACATAAPQGHAPAAASRGHRRPAAPKDGPRAAALTAAAQAAEAGVRRQLCCPAPRRGRAPGLPAAGPPTSIRCRRARRCRRVPSAPGGCGPGRSPRTRASTGATTRPRVSRSGRGSWPATSHRRTSSSLRGSTGTSPGRPRRSCAGPPASGASTRTSCSPRPRWRAGGGRPRWATGRAAAARPGTAPGWTASRACARRAGGSCRTGIPTSSRAGRGSRTPPR